MSIFDMNEHIIKNAFIINYESVFISKNYSAAGAETGHVPAQAPQSIHVSASITYLPSPSEIAPTGHSPAHAPQLMHSS